MPVVAALYLEDIREIERRRKGKASIRVGPSDEELAFQLFAQEAQALQALTRDMTMARSLDRALRTDTALLDEHERYEEAARRDREVAHALAENRPPPANDTAAPSSTGSMVFRVPAMSEQQRFRNQVANIRLLRRYAFCISVVTHYTEIEAMYE